MDRKTKICLWVILIGLINFVAFALLWFSIGGDAISGEVTTGPDGGHTYWLKAPGEAKVSVSKLVFLYSGVHCISIWITVAAVLLAILTLAKDYIAWSTHSTLRAMITLLAIVITVTICFIAYTFVRAFIMNLVNPVAAAQ